jgi:putative heme-binding domain-containing protein
LEENQAIELLLDRDERVANYVAGQMLRSGQVSKRVVASMVARAGMSDSIDPLLAMRLVIGLANYGDTTDREPIRKSCDLLLANSSLRGFEIALEFINPDRVGLIVEELIQRDDLRGTGYLNRLVPKLPSSELTRIVGLIVGHQGARPAWHYLLTRQLASSAGVTALENELIDRIYAESKTIVSSSEGTLALKLAAWELYSSRLIDDSQAEVGELLERLANSDEAFVEVVVSGVYKLGEASRIALLRSSRTWPRPLRRSVISNFVGNPQGIRLLMESLDRGELKADMVEPSQIEVLRQNAQEVYAKSVVKWFGSDDAGDRKEAIDRFEKNWPAQFEIAQGKMLYETHCAKCHRGQVVDGLTAPPIGPSLQALSHWTNRAWLEAIIDPSKSVDDRYKRSLIRTKEDLVFSGLKIQESDEFLELVFADGRVEKIARNDIEDIKESNQSLMPDGFEKLLTPEQMAQIVTYLRRGGD